MNERKGIEGSGGGGPKAGKSSLSRQGGSTRPDEGKTWETVGLAGRQPARKMKKGKHGVVDGGL